MEKYFQNSEQVLFPSSQISTLNVPDKGSTPLSLLFKYNSASYQGDLPPEEIPKKVIMTMIGKSKAPKIDCPAF